MRELYAEWLPDSSEKQNLMIKNKTNETYYIVYVFVPAAKLCE